ncbi:hypothetical protein RJ639_046305 [Escallonia herrerae]|uniref:Transposase Tnp1/En/Spm-like domain-containing protein n=1 Tax=Escallonia herrerae TaxID=1293975 RepID=A0AA88WGQ8_9ASTE|nr:hypothetical protein RJ639_046305 [Escallonia herrerae]
MRADLFGSKVPKQVLAQGVLCSKDPLKEVGGPKQLGNEFWEVYVEKVKKPAELLVRPYKDVQTVEGESDKGMLYGLKQIEARSLKKLEIRDIHTPPPTPTPIATTATQFTLPPPPPQPLHVLCSPVHTAASRTTIAKTPTSVTKSEPALPQPN